MSNGYELTASGAGLSIYSPYDLPLIAPEMAFVTEIVGEPFSCYRVKAWIGSRVAIFITSVTLPSTHALAILSPWHSFT